MSNLPTLDRESNLRCLELTREAGAWLKSLATPVRVHDLVEQAPDIANQLAASWNNAPSTTLLLEQLPLDEGMDSMPPVVASELLRLYEYHVRCRTVDAPNTTWELPVWAPGPSADDGISWEPTMNTFISLGLRPRFSARQSSRSGPCCGRTSKRADQGARATHGTATHRAPPHRTMEAADRSTAT